MLIEAPTLIVAMGFAQADAVAAVAPQYPDINFVAVDVCWLDDPAGNIYQACYLEHEGSFLGRGNCCYGIKNWNNRFCWWNGYSINSENSKVVMNRGPYMLILILKY